jgi:hypothetical protein
MPRREWDYRLVLFFEEKQRKKDLGEWRAGDKLSGRDHSSNPPRHDKHGTSLLGLEMDSKRRAFVLLVCVALTHTLAGTLDRTLGHWGLETRHASRTPSQAKPRTHTAHHTGPDLSTHARHTCGQVVFRFKCIKGPDLIYQHRPSVTREFVHCGKRWKSIRRSTKFSYLVHMRWFLSWCARIDSYYSV